MHRRRSDPRRRRFATATLITRLPNRLVAGLRKTQAGAVIVRPAPEVHFSARPAEALRADSLRHEQAR